MFSAKNSNFASQYEKFEKKAQAALVDLTAAFEGAQ
jgi:hypothetical protein